MNIKNKLFKFIIEENANLGNIFLGLCSPKDILTLKHVCKWTHSLLEHDEASKVLNALKRSVQEINDAFYDLQKFWNTPLFFRLVAYNPFADEIDLELFLSVHKERKSIRASLYHFIKHAKFDPKAIEESNKESKVKLEKMHDCSKKLNTLQVKKEIVHLVLTTIIAIIMLLMISISYETQEIYHASKCLTQNDLRQYI